MNISDRVRDKPFQCIFFFLITVVCGSLSAQTPQWFYFSEENNITNIPDNSEIRKKREEFIFAPVSEALKASENVYQQNNQAHRVLFQVRKQNGFFYFLFINEKEFRFPLYSRGSYIIKRSEKDGKFIQVKIFLRDEPDTFLRIFPYDNRSLMDIFIAGTRLYKDIVLPLSFNDVLLSPFQRVIAAAPVTVDWSILFPPGDGGYSVVENMVEKIRNRIHGLRDADDGAMDRGGNFVYINTLQPREAGGFNCSGFAKWVVDGLYKPLAGECMSITELKNRHLQLRGNRWSLRHETERDPYFGLDWTRNLAALLEEARYGVNTSGREEEFDVRSVPGFSYVEDVGFPIEDIRYILYYLALKNPGSIYLGSVNRNFGEDPVLRQHVHVVVFLPYFEKDGRFTLAVMERNGETSDASLFQRYPKDYVHLVEIEGDKEFYLPEFE